MPAKGQTIVEFNPVFFDEIMRTAGVERLTDDAAERALAIAKATAPVDTGDYRDGLHIEHRESKHRRVTRVVGDDAKTLLVESKTGNLARALKQAAKT
jgi:hypothetical protein